MSWIIKVHEYKKHLRWIFPWSLSIDKKPGRYSKIRMRTIHTCYKVYQIHWIKVKWNNQASHLSCVGWWTNNLQLTWNHQTLSKHKIETSMWGDHIKAVNHQPWCHEGKSHKCSVINTQQRNLMTQSLKFCETVTLLILTFTRAIHQCIVMKSIIVQTRRFRKPSQIGLKHCQQVFLSKVWCLNVKMMMSSHLSHEAMKHITHTIQWTQSLYKTRRSWVHES